MSDDNKRDLAPCPFCGNTDVAMHPNDLAQNGSQMARPGSDLSFAHCDGCGADGPPGDSDDEAAAAWNRRAASAQAEPATDTATLVSDLKVLIGRAINYPYTERSKKWSAEVFAKIDALAAPAPLAGLVLVPREPTEAMLQAGCDAQNRAVYRNPQPNGLGFARVYWDAMVEAAAAPVAGADWLPTPENINALAQPIRSYIRDLETNTDPAGNVRENTMLKDCNRGLQAMYRRTSDEAMETRRKADGDTAVGAAMKRAAAELPEGWTLEIHLERDAGTVRLVTPDYDESLVSADGGLLAEIEAAIEQAKAGGGA